MMPELKGSRSQRRAPVRSRRAPTAGHRWTARHGGIPGARLNGLMTPPCKHNERRTL